MKIYTATGINQQGKPQTITGESTDLHSFMCWVCQQGIRNIKKYEQIN